MVDIFSTEDYRKILNNYFGTCELNIKETQIFPISENSEGFMGQHYRLQITYEQNKQENSISFFVKTKTNKDQSEVLKTSPVYTKEIFFYDFLLKEFEKYGYDISFAAKSYFVIPDKTLVLDDLTKKGFELTKETEFDLKQTEVALKSLAIFHAASFAYEETKKQEFGWDFRLDKVYPKEFREMVFHKCIPGYMEKDIFWSNNFITLDALIGLLPEDEKYKRTFRELLEKAEVCKIFTEETNLPKCCGHGDLWANNFMFKYENNIPIKACLVDFQFCRYFYPSVDVILAIYSNTSNQFRKKHLLYLYRYYYDTLSSILKNYGFSINNILSLEDFHQSLQLVKVDVITQVTLLKAMIYLMSVTYKGSIKNDSNFLSKVLYDKKEMVIKEFNEDEIFKKMMTEAMTDLFDSLLEKFKI